MSEDIQVTDGTILEALNNKVDLDGGNYKGSELEAYIHEHCVGDLVAQMELKADINLSNLTDVGKNNVVNFVMPNENTVSFTIGASFAEYIAPADGYFFATATYNGGAGYLVLTYGSTAMSMGNSVIAYYTTPVGYGMRTFVPVAKGQSIFFGYQGVKDTSLKFCYAIGSGSEAE